MRRLLLISLFALGLCSCGPSGTAVYDKNDSRVGNVSVTSATKATVYGKDGYTRGEIISQNIYDSDGTRVGYVQTDGDIVDTNGYSKGQIDGKRCEDDDGYLIGTIAEDIDDEAAGGACLLLLLSN